MGSRNGQKNNCMAISIGKPAKSHAKKTKSWLKKGKLKRETETFQRAAQNNAIRTNYTKSKIDNSQLNSKCRFRGDKDETIT